MTTFFVYVLPIILVAICASLMRTCFVRCEDVWVDSDLRYAPTPTEKPLISRAVYAAAVIVSFVPILGLFEAVSLIAVTILCCFNDSRIKKNKLTKYWLDKE
jgi:hypothetical protein